MIISSDNQVIYDGDGLATQFAYTFAVKEVSHLYLIKVNADGTESPITSDYYVDLDKKIVYYPGYAPGAQEPDRDVPDVLAAGEKLIIYREVPITQEVDMPENYPFNLIEDMADKGTIIDQQLAEGLLRSLKINRAAYSYDFDGTIPVVPGKTFRFSEDGKRLEATEDPGKVIETAQGVLTRAEAVAEQANDAATRAEEAAEEAKFGSGTFVTPEMYGAVGDGVTDDTAAIQAAIDTHKMVVLTAGKTYIATKFNLYHGVKIYGNGATIKRPNLKDAPYNYTNSQINSLRTFNMSTATVGLNTEGLVSEFKDLTIDANCWTVGWEWDSTSDSKKYAFEQGVAFFLSCSDSNYPVKVLLENIHFRNNYASNVSVQNNVELIMNNCTSYDCIKGICTIVGGNNTINISNALSTHNYNFKSFWYEKNSSALESYNKINIVNSKLVGNINAVTTKEGCLNFVNTYIEGNAFNFVCGGGEDGKHTIQVSNSVIVLPGDTSTFNLRGYGSIKFSNCDISGGRGVEFPLSSDTNQYIKASFEHCTFHDLTKCFGFEANTFPKVNIDNCHFKDVASYVAGANAGKTNTDFEYCYFTNCTFDVECYLTNFSGSTTAKQPIFNGGNKILNADNKGIRIYGSNILTFNDEYWNVAVPISKYRSGNAYVAKGVGKRTTFLAEAPSFVGINDIDYVKLTVEPYTTYKYTNNSWQLVTDGEGGDVPPEVLQQIETNRQNIAANTSAIAEQSGEIMQQQKALESVAEDVRLLKHFAKGELYTEYVDDSVAHTKSVPKSADEKALLNSVCGKTYVENQLIDYTKFPASYSQNGITYTNNNDGSFTVSGTNESTSSVVIRLDATVKVIQGHYYAILGYSGLWSDNALYISDLKVFSGALIDYSPNNYRQALSSTTTVLTFTVWAGKTVNATIYPQLIDLTVMGGYTTLDSSMKQALVNNPIPYTEPTIQHTTTESVVCKTKAGDIIQSYPLPTTEQDGWSAISVCNERDFARGKRIKRVGRVDLGSLNWRYSGFKFFLNTTKTITTVQTQNAICSMYESLKSDTNVFFSNSNSINDKVLCYANGDVIIRDDSITNADTFKQAMQGVYLYYELAEPIETDLEDTINPIIVEGNGSVEFVNTENSNIPIPSSISYCVSTKEGL